MSIVDGMNESLVRDELNEVIRELERQEISYSLRVISIPSVSWYAELVVRNAEHTQLKQLLKLGFHLENGRMVREFEYTWEEQENSL